MNKNVILSEAKDFTVGMRSYCNRLINEAKMIQSRLKILSAGERSLAPFGMAK
jgi:hypothetical protein